MNIEITYETINDIKGPKIIIYTTYDKKYYIHNKINSILDQIKKNYFLIESYDENLFNILIDNKQQYDSLSSIFKRIPFQYFVIFEDKDVDLDEILGYFFLDKLKEKE